jgi:hypothetical protein
MATTILQVREKLDPVQGIWHIPFVVDGVIVVHWINLAFAGFCFIGICYK